LNLYLSQLKAAVQAVGFLNDTQFTWFGTASEALSSAVRRALTPETTRSFLHYQLQQTLYSQFYTKGAPLPHSDSAEWAREDPGFVAELAAANQGKGSVETGWTARGVRAGRVVVERQGLTLEVAPEACVPPISEPLASAVQISLRVPSARPNLSPGYFLVIGDTPISRGDGLVRLYWHLKPGGAARWLQSATAALNARNLPFHLKVLHSPQLFTRCDAGVLYLPQSAFGAAQPALRHIYAHVEAELRSEAPAFTKSLAPGIGLAESPAGESFGLNRCHLIADGLVRSRTEGRTDTAGRLDCVLTCWVDAGLDIERPYLNPGSQDVYDALRSPTRRNATVASSTEREQAIQPTACLNVAVEIGTRLARETIWHGDRCTWLGAEMLGPGVTSYGTLCPDVYSGIAGVGLFLAALWQVARIEEVRLAAVGAIRQALAGVDGLRETNVVGLYTGALGVCWAAVRAAISLEESGLVDEATIELQLCRDCQRAKTEDEWDLLAGNAGAILGALWLWHHLGDDSLLEWATRLGKALIAAGTRDRTGSLSWRRRRGQGARALTGYSHGAAGAGIALLELGAAVRNEGFQEAGLAAIKYERRWYDAVQGNWPDFRRSDGRSQTARQFSTAWCHGAPGIALSRLRAMQLAPSPEIASELHAALETTTLATAAMLDASGTTFCLCHGLAGNAEVLNLCANGAPPSLVWRVAARCRRISGAERAPSPDASPGLMLGRSGIGLFYLRLFDPSVPSVLLPYP
jgi:Lanthionine synthetase C-like protein/HopA1 effector protein family